MKTFCRENLSKVQLRKRISITAKQFGVNKLIFSSTGKYVRGTYNPFNNNIFLDLKQTKKDLLNTFFHELGHHVAVKNKRWNVYHFNLAPTMTIERMFRIENKIDKIAKKLWNKYVDLKQWGKYNYAYPKARKKQIMNYINSTL
jgi:hypothetical protein